jgi:MerE protein
MRMRIKGYLLVGSALAACPCHLPLTLPLLAALFAGTALGVFLANNVWLIVALSTIYFFDALVLGWRALGATERGDCPMPKESSVIAETLDSKRWRA